MMSRSGFSCSLQVGILNNHYEISVRLSMVIDNTKSVYRQALLGTGTSNRVRLEVACIYIKTVATASESANKFFSAGR